MPATNSTYTQVAVQWLNQALYFYQSLCLTENGSASKSPPSGSCKTLGVIIKRQNREK